MAVPSVDGAVYSPIKNEVERSVGALTAGNKRKPHKCGQSAKTVHKAVRLKRLDQSLLLIRQMAAYPEYKNGGCKKTPEVQCTMSKLLKARNIILYYFVYFLFISLAYLYYILTGFLVLIVGISLYISYLVECLKQKFITKLELSSGSLGYILVASPCFIISLFLFLIYFFSVILYNLLEDWKNKVTTKLELEPQHSQPQQSQPQQSQPCKQCCKKITPRSTFTNRKKSAAQKKKFKY